VSAEPVQKRGPGRPRKYPKVLASGHPQEHPVAEEVLLHPVAGEELQKPKAEAVLKRPRGRPPKVRDAEASVVQMSGMGFMFKHHLQYKGRLLLTHFFIASTAMVVSPLGQHKVKETEVIINTTHQLIVCCFNN
jgi:hypothetical protein